MKRIWMMTTLLSALVIPQVGNAVVDMKNSNYAENFLDISLAGTGYALKVQRYYNSRSLFTGIFGFGWCSDFETTIDKTPEGRLVLAECGAGQEVIYSPTTFDPKALDSAVEKLTVYYKKKNPGANAQRIAAFQQQLRQYAEIRNEWAKEAGVTLADAKKGTIYKAEGLEVEQISFDGKEYTRILSDGTSQKFNVNGRLIALFDKNGNSLKLNYNSDGLPVEVIDTMSKKLSFRYYPTKRVKEIVGPNGTRAEYEFKGEDLVKVKNMWGNTYTFQYDGSHNLTRINYPDDTFKALTYSEKNDWVMSFTDRAPEKGPACTETYQYELDKENPKDHYWSTAVKKCGTVVKNEARFEFWHKTRDDGRKYLHRVLTKSLTDSLDVTYHPFFGRPTLIRKNGVTTQFDYFENGLIKEKATSVVRLKFEYKNQYNKVSLVKAEYFDAKGKVVRKRETNFTYDAKANLVAAQNSDGQSVKLSYDSRGRIASIVDQAKKEVLIKYEDKTGKPSSITRPKVGTINVTYKPNGEIQQVKSEDNDPTVAVQIASTFNNLLDIIAPATSELNL